MERVRDLKEGYGSAALTGTVVNDTICLGQIDLRQDLDTALDMYSVVADSALELVSEDDDFIQHK